MATWLRHNTAVDIKIGPFLDDTDGKTPEDALTITQPDIRLAKNGGNWAQKSAGQTLAHEENGWYEAALSETDTNTLGVLIVAVHKAGALPVWREFLVVPQEVYDAMVWGIGSGVRAEVQALAANAVTASAIADNAITASKIANNAITSGKIADGALTAAKIADGALTAAKFAAGALDGVWSVASRTLTAGTNIVLAKGTGVTGFNDLDAAGVRSAVGLASANLDTQLDALPTAAEIADAVWDEPKADHTGAATFGDVGADTDTILTRLPSALIAGKIDANISGMTPGVITSAAFSDGAITADKIANNAITSGKIADGALTAAKFAAGALDGVWSVASRTLTAGTNIVLAKGTGVTGFNDISVADIAAMVIETGYSLKNSLRLMLAALAGKASGMGSVEGKFRNPNDTRDRITATIDEYGNRSSLTYDLND